MLSTDVTSGLRRPKLNPEPQIRKTYSTADLKKIEGNNTLELVHYLCFVEFSPKLYPADSQNIL